MKNFLRTVLLFAIVNLAFSAHPKKASNTAETSTHVPTTPHPTNIKLQQLKNMEESALKGWYDMVNNFLVLIKPDHKTLDLVIDFLNGTSELDLQATVFEIIKMNYAFLALIIVGIVYVVVMVITGLFFFCCRFWGRCGAKDSQTQRRSDNCWRTMHKFSLILMIAFLVVPIACMWIINQHIRESSDGVRGNLTEVFDILNEFANDTDREADEKLSTPLISPLQNFDSFKSTFVELVHDNITSSIDNEKLEEIKNIVNWILAVEDQHSEIGNASTLSKSVADLKSRIMSIRKDIDALTQSCSDSQRKICNLNLKRLPLESMNVNLAYVNVQSEFQKLLKINFEELKSIIDKIQNNTVLKNKIEEESESLRRFAQDAKPSDLTALEGVKKQIKNYTQQLRDFSYYSKQNLTFYMNKSVEHEDHRWYAMFGIAGILFIPVALLSLGLMCGCCGYEKERHPTKRSSTSNCGGMCLVMGVYFFFLVSSALMVLTMALFILGGSAHTFVCIPLFQKDFIILDQMKTKLNYHVNNSMLQDTIPSKLLLNCQEDMSIIVALGLFNDSDPQYYEHILSNPSISNTIDSEEIDIKLKNAILEITSGIRERLEQFTNALNLQEMKDIPLKLQDSLKSSKANLSEFIDEVRSALEEETDNAEALLMVNESAASLFEVIDDFERKLSNFSTPLLNIYKEADNYKAKIREIEKSLDKVEEKLPKVIKTHLFQAIGSSTGLTDKIREIGKCYRIWISFDISRTAVCEFIVNPVNGYWFALGWALVFIIPTIFFSVKLSRYYLRMKYDDDLYIHDSEAMPLDDMGRTKPFSYTPPGHINWMHQFAQHQNYIVHPTSNHARQFHYK